MKCAASVVTLISIVACVAFASDAKAEARVLVSQNETAEFDLDSPSLFPASKPTKPPAAPSPSDVRAKPTTKQVAIEDIELDEDDDTAPSANSKRTQRAQAKRQSARKPASDVEVIVYEKRDDVVEKKIDMALLLEKKKDYKKIVEILQPFTERLPRRGLMTLARAAKGVGDSTLEIKTLQLSLAKNAKDYVVQTQLGEVFSRLKRPNDAIAAFQSAIELNKRFEPAYEGLWMELEKGREYYEARSVLSDMMNLFGEKPKFFSALCRLYSFDDYLEKATEVCRAAIERDPKHADNYVHLAVSLRDQEGGAQAQKLLAGAAKRFPASETVQTTTGSLYLGNKDYAVAYKYYKQATKADPKSTRAWQGLANTAFELQKNEEAMEAYGKACDIDRKMTKDLRVAISKLRARKDTQWEMRYESRLLKCD